MSRTLGGDGTVLKGGRSVSGASSAVERKLRAERAVRRSSRAWVCSVRNEYQAFQMSTAQRQSPSDSRRQIVTARPSIVNGLPSGPFIVTAFALNM